MIETTWGSIRHNEVNAFLSRITKEKMPYATTLKVLLLVKALETEQKKAHAMYETLRAQFFKKAEDGKSLVPKEGIDEKEMEETFEKFMKTPCKIDAQKLTAEDLNKIELSAVELNSAEPFIEKN